MNAQPYDFTLPAFGSVELAVAGSMVKLLSANGKIKIETDSGANVTCEVGQGIRNFDFQKIRIIDKSGALNAGFLLVGDAEMIDDRISGEVSVIEGGKIRTASNIAFMGVVASGGAAGLYPHTEVWNPAGSGVNTYVSQIVMASSVGAQIGCGLSNTQLANLAQQTKSKKFGGADGKSQSRWENNAAQIGGNQYGFYTYAPANQPIIWKPTEPFMLVPGSGLIVCPASTASAWVYTSFDIYEEAI